MRNKFSKLDNKVTITEAHRNSFGFEKGEDESPYFKGQQEPSMGKLYRRRTFAPNRDLEMKLKEMELAHYLDQ